VKSGGIIGFRVSGFRVQGFRFQVTGYKFPVSNPKIKPIVKKPIRTSFLL
jgi:hypothetical protein